MNKKILHVMMVVFFMFFVFGTFAVKAEESVDPTGVLQQYLEMERDHYDAVQSFFNGITCDQHPTQGCVTKEAFPLHENGWSEEYVPELFPNQNVLSYEQSYSEISGKALVAHKDGEGNIFYVWHQFDAEPVVLVKAEIEGQEKPQMAMAAYHCGNPIFINTDTWVFYVDGIQVPWYVAKWYLRQM